MSGFTAIDLSQLPLPEAVVVPDFEAALADLKARVIALQPDLADVIGLESEPVVKVLEVAAYLSVLHRAQVNDAVRAVHLATATGPDLDNLAALFAVRRLVVDPGDPEAVPPIPPRHEDDAAFRLRAQLALEGFSTAGPVGAYEFHARSADARVKDVAVSSPEPGRVLVTVLSSVGDGAASVEVGDRVTAALGSEDVRPLCDEVIVESAAIVAYTVEAELKVRSGPDMTVVRDAAAAALATYVSEVHAIGVPVARSGILAALHRPGVARVVLTAPVADIEVAASEAGFCAGVVLTATEDA